MQITTDVLETCANQPVADALGAPLADALNAVFISRGVQDGPEQQCFLAEACIETAYFRTLVEYGDAAYFARYDGRHDLGNSQPGDGFRFRGRGALQITGRWNYQHFGSELGIDLIGDPDLAATPDVAAKIAGQFWIERHCYLPARAGNIEQVTKLVNGGLNGLADRVAAFQRLSDAWAALATQAAAPPATP